MTISCTIIRRSDTGTVDDYGDAERIVSTLDTKCEIQPASEEEPANAGEVSLVSHKAWFPPGTDLRTGDAVATAEAQFEVVGAPADWNDLVGQDDFLEADLKRTVDEDLS